MRISDWSSDVCSSDLLHGETNTVKPFPSSRIGLVNRQAPASYRYFTTPKSTQHARHSFMARAPARLGRLAGEIECLAGNLLGLIRIGKAQHRDGRCSVAPDIKERLQIGSAHVCTPVTNAHLVC